jgi:hypothetical protein
MIDQIWTFLRDEDNRNVLGWIGAGLVVVLGGVIRHFMKRSSNRAKGVKASHGGVAAGRDIRDSQVTTRERSEK